MVSTIRSFAKKLIYGYLPGTAGAFPYYNSKVYFPLGSEVFDIVCKQGIFEPGIVRFLQGLVVPDTVFFDIGANIGLMAVPVLQSCPSCDVVSFEPSPNSVPFLKKTIANSLYKDRWSLIAKALSNSENEEVEFFIGSSKKSMFEGLGSHRQLDQQQGVMVSVSTLDKEWQALGKPVVSLIKIDVEGAEGLILDGAYNLLSDQAPTLVVEWYKDFLQPFGTSPDRLLSIAREFGYRVFSIPAGVPIDDLPALKVQMMICSNFLLIGR